MRSLLIPVLVLLPWCAVPAASAQAPAARWALVPEARIGAVDGPAALSEVRNLAVGADGTLYVSQLAERTVRVFDASGRPVRRLGRSGRGPGEFSNPGRLALRGDTLWVSDFALRRVSAFSTRDGRFLHDHTLPGWTHEGAGTPVRSAVPVAGGALVGSPASAMTRVANGEITAEPLLRMEPPSLRPEVVSWLSTRNRVLYAQLAPGRVMAGPQLVSDAPLWDVSADGGGILVVERTAASSADSAAFTVTRSRPDGTPQWRHRYRYAPRPFPRGFDRTLIDRYLGNARPGAVPDREAAERGIRRAMYLPPYRPPVTALVPGRDGTVWLRREEPDPGASAVWNVLDESGRVLAIATVPPGVEVLAADRRHVWGVVHDEMDVPFIVRYRIETR